MYVNIYTNTYIIFKYLSVYLNTYKAYENIYTL